MEKLSQGAPNKSQPLQAKGPKSLVDMGKMCYGQKIKCSAYAYVTKPTSLTPLK